MTDEPTETTEPADGGTAGAGGPMTGLRVVELGVWVAGPAAGGILADWGADVIKVEPPVGDPARTFGTMLGGELPTNPPFELDNRSKRSICLDLSEDQGREILLRLLDTADVFLTNIRPAALERLGLGPDEVRARCPRLIYALITGFGFEGPEAHRPAYDIAAFWARSGIAAALKTPDGPLPFQRGGMGDHSIGMTAAAMIGAALYGRERTGEGDLVSTSLLRQGAYTIGFDVNVAAMWGRTIQLGDRATMGNLAANNYTAGDGRMFWLVGLDAQRHWPPLARAVDHPEWIDDERFATPIDRYRNAAELIALLDEIFASRTLEEWAERFDAEPDLFWTPVQSIDELIGDEQFRASGGFVEVPDPSGGTATMVATPADFQDHPWAPRSTAPGLGAHTAQILAELGIDGG